MRILLVTLLLTVLMLPAGQAQQVVNPDLRDMLTNMAQSHELFRAQIDSLRKEPRLNEREIRNLVEEQLAIDAENQRLLEAIVEQHGWPGKSLVGEDAAGSALTILEHADHNYQKQHLPLLRAAAQEEELPADKIAVLEDQVRMRDGRPQLYGTQFRHEQHDNQEHLYPIEDAAEVNARRAEVGLPPIEEVLEEKGIEWRPPGSKPEVIEEPEPIEPPKPRSSQEVVKQDSTGANTPPDSTKASNW
ncbi:hypothetical protein KQI63_16685 [bacterium]|nr:hypothetical protein [bacterium]